MQVDETILIASVVLGTLTGCGSTSPPPATNPTVSGGPPLQVQCIVASPSPGLLAVASSSPGLQISATVKSICTDLVSQNGWLPKPNDTSTEGYQMICSSTYRKGEAIVGLWSLSDERSKGIAYDICAKLSDVTYVTPP